MKGQWKILFQLFWTFFKISPVTFGGGFAMIPFIEKEVVEKRKWLKSEELQMCSRYPNPYRELLRLTPPPLSVIE